MTKNAALLIDFETFFISREHKFNLTGNGYINEALNSDLTSLRDVALELVGDHKLVLRRAYANFNDRRQTGRKEYYLEPASRTLMELGIEPVQVFRIPGMNNKNAADMRLAIDAIAQMYVGEGVDRFILVAGDGDYVPLVLELKRLGAKVALIGVQGSTRSVLTRYCDRFDIFEELLAANDASGENHKEFFKTLRNIFCQLLEERTTIKFDAVNPMLTKQLTYSFDPTKFGYENTSEFLRDNATSLGIVVRKGEHGWEIHPPTSTQEIATRQDVQAIPEHTTAKYRQLLRSEYPKINIVAHKAFTLVTDELFEQSKDKEVYYDDLCMGIKDKCDEEGIEDAGQIVDAVASQAFKSGTYVCADNNSSTNTTDFDWRAPAKLNPKVTSVEDIRHRTRIYILDLLTVRLQHDPASSKIVQPKPIAELFFGAEPTDDKMQKVQQLIELTEHHLKAEGSPPPDYTCKILGRQRVVKS